MKKKDAKKQSEEYVCVNKKRYKKLLTDVELLKVKMDALNARLSQILTVFNKVDARGRYFRVSD